MSRNGGGLRVAARRMLAPSTGARRHLAPGLSVEGFFDELKYNGTQYVVLRWFDTLPHVDEGEDIDLLVADEDLPFVQSLMAPRAGLRAKQKFDVYSVSGLPGSDFHGIPYYLPRFAQEVLDSGQWSKGRYRVPDLQQHYDSLAYHAVYHKGYASGLGRTSSEEGLQPIEHEYEAVLAGLGARLGRPGRPTLDSLDCYLAGRGLRPPLDTLERLEPANVWITHRFFSHEAPVDALWRGLAVFVLRERAQAQVDLAVRELDLQGFELLEVVHLDALQREAAAHRIRGGNWGRGPWPLSGGPPAAYVIVYDVAPLSSSASGGVRDANVRIATTKECLRRSLLADVAPEAAYNPVHSSDNAVQALDYLEALTDPDLQARVQDRAGRLVNACEFPYPVVRALAGQARRARVAVVQHPLHGETVCKVFRPGAVRFFEREMRARKDLSDLAPIPDLLESGERWLLMPKYEDDRRHVRRDIPGGHAQLTPDASHALARFAVALHLRGLFLLDLSTQNLLSDPDAGLKILDLEFLQEYSEAVPDVSRNYTFVGVQHGVGGYDVPLTVASPRRHGPAGLAGLANPVFHPAITGSSVEQLLPHRRFDALRRALVQDAWYVLLLQRRRVLEGLAAVRTSRSARDVRAVGRIVLRRTRTA